MNLALKTVLLGPLSKLLAQLRQRRVNMTDLKLQRNMTEIRYRIQLQSDVLWPLITVALLDENCFRYNAYM